MGSNDDLRELMEQAAALFKTHKNQTTVGGILHKSQGYISFLLHFPKEAIPDVQNALWEGRIKRARAKELYKLPTSEQEAILHGLLHPTDEHEQTVLKAKLDRRSRKRSYPRPKQQAFMSTLYEFRKMKGIMNEDYHRGAMKGLQYAYGIISRKDLENQDMDPLPIW
jgi:hypothetical protein